MLRWRRGLLLLLLPAVPNTAARGKAAVVRGEGTGTIAPRLCRNACIAAVVAASVLAVGIPPSRPGHACTGTGPPPHVAPLHRAHSLARSLTLSLSLSRPYFVQTNTVLPLYLYIVFAPAPWLDYYYYYKKIMTNARSNESRIGSGVGGGGVHVKMWKCDFTPDILYTVAISSVVRAVDKTTTKSLPHSFAQGIF